VTAAFVRKGRIRKHTQFEKKGEKRAVAYWQFVSFYPQLRGVEVVHQAQYPAEECRFSDANKPFSAHHFLSPLLLVS